VTRQDFVGTERFTIEERIGAGATGYVYRARDNERHATVALKLLKRYDATALYRFKQEFRALSDVSHPNLVELYELVSLGEQWFFTMELVRGISFLSYVRGGAVDELTPVGARLETERDLDEDTADTMSLPTMSASTTLQTSQSTGDSASQNAGRRSSPHIAPPAITVPQLERLRAAVAQVVDGVTALHDAGQLHRDIKPSNVLVTEDERAVVLDFGVVAELTPGTNKHAGEARVVGTPAYMAPEQGAGSPVSPNSDWYSVGVMMYEALTGRRPFVGAARDIIAAKQTHDPRPVRELAPEAPPVLAGLVMDLLQRDPAKRPSANEILERLGKNERSSQPRINQRSAAVEPVGFVGRGAHIEMLRAAYAVVATGESRTVFVHGSSGVGKTALANHFLAELRERGEAVVLAGRCYERESVPYKALDDLIDALSRYLLDLPRRDVWDLMPEGVYALARLFPVLRRVEAVLGAASRDLAAMHPHELRRHAFDALRDLLTRLARKAPLVLFIDDVQWGDSDSAALLAHVMRASSAPPILLVAAYRREDAGTSPLLRSLVPAQQAAVSLAVDPLTDHETRELAVHLLGMDNDVARNLARSIARESGGNPFFVHELVRFIRDHDELTTIGHLSLEAVLSRRVASLPKGARALLDLVAIAGRPVSQAVVMRAANLGADEHAALTALRMANLVHTRGTRDRDAIECLHDRIREAAIARLGDEQRREQHRRLAAVYEAFGGADPETLSRHFERAGDVRRAGSYSIDAADAAMEALAFDRAASLYERAIKLRNPGGEELALLRGRLGDALAHAGRRAEAAATYREASLVATSAADRFELGRRAAEAYLWSGHVDEGVRALEQVLSSVDLRMPGTRRRSMFSFVMRRAWIRIRGLRYKLRDSTQLTPHELSRINALWTAAAGFAMCDLMLGADFQARHLLASLRSGERFEVARALAVEAAYLSVRGRRGIVRSLRVSQRAIAVAEQVGDPLITAWAHGAEAIVKYQAGSFSESREQSERASSLLAGRHGASWELSTLQQYRVWALYYLGELAEMTRTVMALARAAEDRGDLYTRTNLTTGIPSAAWLVRDEPDEVIRLAREANERWTRQGFHLQHFWSFVGRIHAHLYAAEVDKALRVVDESWRPLSKSMLLRVSMVRVESHHARARAAVLAAKRGRDRDAMLDLVEKDSRRVEKENVPFASGIATAQRAGAAAVRGDTDDAEALLRKAIALFDTSELGLYAAAARWRLGAMRGGDEGEAMVDAAKVAFKKQRVRNPAQMLAFLVPGFDE
jgi:tetratricopeptide (TPR) repeat protein